MASLIWVVITLLIFVYYWWANRLIARDAEAERFDAGLAIIEFGRAYPDEAIRQIIVTADGGMFFLRLWNGRIGCMRPNGRHYQCHIIDPGHVAVGEVDDAYSLDVTFPGTRMTGGRFTFKSPREASEVSLWLLGSFVPAGLEGVGLAPA